VIQDKMERRTEVLRGIRLGNPKGNATRKLGSGFSYNRTPSNIPYHSLAYPLFKGEELTWLTQQGRV
jgi:hypothetical protein